MNPPLQASEANQLPGTISPETAKHFYRQHQSLCTLQVLQEVDRLNEAIREFALLANEDRPALLAAAEVMRDLSYNLARLSVWATQLNMYLYPDFPEQLPATYQDW